MGKEPADPQNAAPPKERTRRISSVGLDRAVLKAGAEIRDKYSEALSERAKADRAVRLFRAALIPRRQPGRRLSESVRIAIEMRASGKNWQNVYAEALPGYRAMDRYERQWRCSNLRRNVRKVLVRRAAKTTMILAPVQNAIEI